MKKQPQLKKQLRSKENDWIEDCNKAAIAIFGEKFLWEFSKFLDGKGPMPTRKKPNEKAKNSKAR